MAESRVCGNSEQARGLKNLMSQTMQLIENNISSMDRAANSINSSWSDDGVGEVDEILVDIHNALKNAQEAMPSVISALEAYAQFLEER